MLATHLSLDSIDLFRNSLLGKGRSTETVRAYAADLTGLLNWSLTLPSLPTTFEAMAAGYLNATRSSTAPKTTCRRLTTFRTYARSAGFPMVLMEYTPPKPKKGNPHPLPGGIDAGRKMIEWSYSTETKAMNTLLCLMAMRISEARSVRPSHFILEKGREGIKIRGKGDVEAIVPLTEEAWENLRPRYFECLRDDAPLVGLSDSGARRAFQRVAKFCNITGKVSSHDGRATVATTLLEKTGDIRVAQEMLRHASVTTTQLYTQVAAERLREAAKL